MTKKEYFDVLLALKKIITGTEWENHLFSVGGCIRDEIMGYPIKDIDLVVDLPNGGIEFANWLCQNHYLVYEPVTYPTYGTAMFKLLEFPDLELEIVETRKEQYKDKESRNPDVVYGSLEEDCMRRDLTINALYYDITNEKIIDLVGGQEDIKKHIIKTPADPDIIYNDDPLRILRCCRFSGRYGWAIEGHTEMGMKRNGERLKIITQERITDEITKSLMTALHPAIPFNLWNYYGLLKHFLPELCGKHWDFYGGIQRQLNSISNNTDNIIPELYFAAIFKEHLGVLKRMKLSNDFIRLTEKIAISLEWVNCKITNKNVRKFGITFGENIDICICFIASYVDAYHYLNEEKNKWVKDFTDKVKELRENGTMFDHTTVLPIDGNDIMESFKLKPSKEVKKLLDEAWDFYYNNPKISKDDLLSYLKDCEDELIFRKAYRAKKLYLSGPMSLCKDEATWKANFQKYEDIFTAKGYYVVNPAKNEILPTYEECLKHSLQQEMECDCIFFMENAILSTGARLEYEIAKACGLEIVLLDNDISFTDNYANYSGIKCKNN